MTQDTTPRSRSFRLIGEPHEIPAIEALLAAQGFVIEPEPFHPLCRRAVHEPMPLGSSLAAFFGRIYIQDRSSMLPPLVLNPPPGARVLDMCASPGSKTGFLAQLVGDGGLVLANEPNKERLATLRRNMAAMDRINVSTCSHPGQELPLPDGGWDHIQLDPPCSGWGTAERHPKVRALWTDDKVQPLVDLQRELLAEASRLLTPGGHVAFSTCTTNVRENEEQVAWAVAELGLEVVPVEPVPGFVFDPPEAHADVASGTLRVNEAESGAQGFYIALLRKPAKADHDTPSKDPHALAEARARDMADLEKRGDRLDPDDPDLTAALDSGSGDAHTSWVDRMPPGHLFRFGQNVHFVPEPALGALPVALRWQGPILGRMGKGDFQPSPRIRRFVPPYAPGAGLDLEDIAPLEQLLTGQSLDAKLLGAIPATDAPGTQKGGQKGKKGKKTQGPAAPKRVGLYYRGLPLGWLRIKGSRLLWAER